MREENRKIRILIVDDSFFTRKLLVDLLSSDAEIEVVGEAQDGVEAIEKAEQLKPDVITMDYTMPNVDGVGAIRKILHGTSPFPAIIMFSSHTKEGAIETFECLRAGAVDFVLKPSGDLSIDLEEVKDILLKKIKAATQSNIQQYKKSETKTKKKLGNSEGNAKVIVIGASTGGPPVLENIISQLPSGLNAAVLVVQHMPKHFTKTFAERLNKISKIPVKEAEEGDVIRSGIILIAPGGFHMRVETNENDKVIHLTKEPSEHGLRPTINISMISAAYSYANEVVGIILTGMGNDGTMGIKAIKEAGGYAIAQSLETSVISSMPNSVIKEGLVDEVLSPDAIVKRIIDLS